MKMPIFALALSYVSAVASQHKITAATQFTFQNIRKYAINFIHSFYKKYQNFVGGYAAHHQQQASGRLVLYATKSL